MEHDNAASNNVLYRDPIRDLVANHVVLFKGRTPRTKSHLPAGWFSLVDTLCSAIEDVMRQESVDLDVFQIKEKFGELRFYHGDDNSECEKISALVRAAALKSCSTCMECGNATEFTAISIERRVCPGCRASKTAPE